MESDDKRLPLYPAWREAERVLLAEGMTHGTLVTDDRLTELFNIEPPRSIADVQRFQLETLGQLDSLRASLLENHRMMLTRARGLGYTVVPPGNQTRLATTIRTREIRNKMRKLVREISHVQVDALTDEQRKENADAIAKVGGLSVMFSKQIRMI